jgi:hypothetical protein
VKMQAGQHVIQEIEVEHDDSAIVIYLQGPDDSLATRATIALLGTILRTPFFDSLRTEQQLGYVVSAGTMPILNSSGLTMTIESPGADPVLLETRINAFLRDYAPQLESMPDSMFDDIMLEEYEQDSTLAMAEAIEALDKAAIAQYYRRYVLPPGSGRLVARSFGNPHRAARTRPGNPDGDGFIVVEDSLESYNAFKAGAELYHFRQSASGKSD